MSWVYNIVLVSRVSCMSLSLSLCMLFSILPVRVDQVQAEIENCHFLSLRRKACTYLNRFTELQL